MDLHFRQSQVDGCRVERWTERDTYYSASEAALPIPTAKNNKTRQRAKGVTQALTDLHQKPRERERIPPHQHPAPIPNHLARTPPEYRKQERPRLVPDPQHEMGGQCDAK